MVKTRRSVTGPSGERDYRETTARRVRKNVTAEGWSPRALRSHYKVTRKRQHWPTQLVSRRLRTIKMPRIMYPESEDSEAEKFTTSRRHPVQVFYKNKDRVRRVAKTSHSGQVDRKLRPLQPNNYMEESDKPIQESECHVRRSGRQRKLIHHTFNESWITNELKVKGYPRLYGMRRMLSSDESSSEDEKLQHIRLNKVNGNIPSEDAEAQQTDKTPEKKVNNLSLRSKKDVKTEGNEEKPIENGLTEGDSDKSKSQPDRKAQSDEESEDKTLAATRRILRSRHTSNQRSNNKKDDAGTNSHSQIDTASDSENSSDSGTDLVVRRQPRRSNRNRKPRNNFIESASRDKEYTLRKKSYQKRKTYSLRERKQPKIIVRTQNRSSSTSSSSSSDSEEEELNVSVKNKTKTKQKSKTFGEHTDRALRDIQPLQLDGSVRFTSVGGLEEHIRCLREMVLFPLMYPQLFERFDSHPPKGVLFHGPPGTGKTLLARALANECSILGGQRVSFFMRKGADCLKKWVGESERNIKLLFQQASKMKPSIIFFDEIDALAPVRSARQDQVHTSVVGTLLAEMDGLCNRGEIIVIGATNRLDAVDPALRRAGRFDRELYFPHPPANQRIAILRVLTSSWNPPPSNETINYIADITTGYGGSDLKALCSESILKALERTYPQIYKTSHALLIDPQRVVVTTEDMINATKGIVAAGSRCAPPSARPLPPHLIPLLSWNVTNALTHAKKLFPPADKLYCSSSNVKHHWSSVCLLRGSCSSTYLGPALLSEIEHCAVRELSVSAIFQNFTFTIEQVLYSLFSEVRRSSQGKNGCVVYVPSIDTLWPLLGDSGSNLVLHLWHEISAINNCLLIATCDCPYDKLPEQLKILFPAFKDCIYNVKEASVSEISKFLRTIFKTKALETPTIEKEEVMPELPQAPPPPPPRPSEAEIRRTARREAHLLRELRIFLRDVCRKLAANRRFYKFTKPVDLEEVTDYLTIVKEPMDLETMMTKVDMHRYNCAREFLKDIDLICANALEYNPDRTSSDKQIRHEACSLRDHAYALVEVEMDTDFEEECRVIAAQREKTGKAATEQELPSFIYTANQTFTNANPAVNNHSETVQNPEHPPEKECEQDQSSTILTSAKKKRKKKQSNWSKGMVSKKAKVVAVHKDSTTPIVTDEDSKENKPVCTSPTFGEPSVTDNDTGHSEHDQMNSAKTSESPSDGNSNSHGAPNDNAESNNAKKSTHDKDEMLFDANAVDATEINKFSNPPSTPSRHGNHNSQIFTSTPHRKKSSPIHSNNDCDKKLIINEDKLESVLQKSVNLVKNLKINQLIELYNLLNLIINKYAAVYDRSELPNELLKATNDFLKAL